MINDNSLVRLSPLKSVVHDKGDGIHISKTALEVMQSQVDMLAEILIVQSTKIAISNKRKTIMEKDIQEAFDDLIHPNLVIDEALEKLEECISSLVKSKQKGFAEHLGA